MQPWTAFLHFAINFTTLGLPGNPVDMCHSNQKEIEPYPKRPNQAKRERDKKQSHKKQNT